MGAERKMPDRYQVVVVGGGPVGMGLAIELGQRGISCAVVERRVTPQRIPKGQNLTQRTLEHFSSWGCVDELRAARILPPDYPIGGVVAYGDLMSDYWHAPAGREAVGEYYFQRNERLPQYSTEAVLRERAHVLPKVTTFYGWSATHVEQDEAGIRVTAVSDANRAEEMTLEADYLVGCDGARSMVREEMGIDRTGADFDQRMVLAVFRSRALHEGLARFPERTTYRVLHPDLKGYWRFFGRIDVGEGWFFHAPVAKDTVEEGYDIHALLEAAAGFSFPYELDHVGFWDLRVEVAQVYRNGRAFIAGDSCHSHPPYYGYGLNSGLEDAANLGWKLGAVLDGWGGDHLLDSYSEERQPIFAETGEDIIAAGIERDRVFLERYSPEHDLVEFERAWTSEMAIADTGPQWYEPHYEGSSVVAGVPGARCSIHGGHSFAARTGHHLAPQRLSDGRNVFEALGTGFTLLAFDVERGAFVDLERSARSLGIPLDIVQDSYADGRRSYGSRLVLVRPDQYVAWVGDEAPEDPGLLLGNVAGLRRTR